MNDRALVMFYIHSLQAKLWGSILLGGKYPSGFKSRVKQLSNVVDITIKDDDAAYKLSAKISNMFNRLAKLPDDLMTPAQKEIVSIIKKYEQVVEKQSVNLNKDSKN